MTLLKAYLNKGEQEYYKQFCKEGVDFSKMVGDRGDTFAVAKYVVREIMCN